MYTCKKNIQNLQLHNFVLFKSSFKTNMSLNQIYQARKGFTTYSRIIVPIFVTKINLSNFFDCKWHLLKLEDSS